MNWYYADAGQQAGPVTETELAGLLQSGKITAATLVWREGMANWQPYAEVQGAGVTAPAEAATPPAGGVVCRECNQVFSPNDVIRYGDVWVCAGCKPIFVQRLKESGNVPGVLEYAGFWVRFVAKFIDGLILGVPFVILLFAVLGSDVLTGAQPPGPKMLAVQLGMQVVFYGLSALYNIFFLGKYGATPGKMALKLRVVRADGAPVTYGRACGRFFAEIISGLVCYIGYLMAGFDEEKRSLHDRICDTRVVRR